MCNKNKCCGCLKHFFCSCCCCCNRKKKDESDEGINRHKGISIVGEIVPELDSDNDSVYNGSSTYEVTATGRENAKSFTDSGVSTIYQPASSMYSGDSAATILKKTVLNDSQSTIKTLPQELVMRMEVKGIINLGGVEQEVQGVLNIGNKEDDVITSQPKSVFAVNKNVTASLRDKKRIYSNMELPSPKPVKKTMSMANRPPAPLPRQKDSTLSRALRVLEDEEEHYRTPAQLPGQKVITVPIHTTDSSISSGGESFEEEEHYVTPISLNLEQPPPLPVKQKQKRFKDNVNSYLSVYDDVPTSSIRKPEITPTIDNNVIENDVVLRKKAVQLNEVSDDHIYEDIEIRPIRY